MSDVKKKVARYILMLPVIAAFILPLLYLPVVMEVSGFNLGFLLVYSVMFQLFFIIFELLDRRYSYIWVGALLVIVLSLIYRDTVLIRNLITAFVIYAGSLVVSHEKIARYSWGLSGLMLSIIWIRFFETPKVVAISLIVLLFFGLMKLIKVEAIYHSGAIVILAVIMAFLPTSEKPMKWKTVKKFLAFVEEKKNTAINEIDYFLDGFMDTGGSYTGYDSTGRLSKGVVSTKSEQLKVNGRTECKYLYLEGGLFSTIGEEGYSGKLEMTPDYNEWLVEFLNGMYQAEVDDSIAVCFSKIESAEITYKYLRTSDIIRPCNLIWIDESLRNGLDKKEGRDFQYKVQYMEIDFGNGVFKDVVKKLEGQEIVYQDYDTIKAYANELYRIDFESRITRDRYKSAVEKLRAGEGMEEYLDTSFATFEMQQLASQITQGAEGDFEKAKKIEKYLRKYKYDKSVDLSDSENFVNDFLFDTKSGYCVHYASSMLMLLRLNGIPARYSSGFAHSTKEGMSVMSNESHAWPEAYIKGVGWVVFEPTTINLAAEDTSWGRKKPVAKKESNIDISREEETTEMSFDESLIDKPQDQPKEEQSGGLDKKMLSRLGLYILAFIGLVILIIILIKVGLMLHYISLTPERKLKKDIDDICRRLEKESKEKLETRSIYDYLEYLSDDAKRKELKEIFDAYYRVRFRGDAAEPDCIKKAHKLSL